jgi:hypothetical protein
MEVGEYRTEGERHARDGGAAVEEGDAGVLD